ncbi:MAG: exodeoxyribonuclease VII large subunit [Candidatus Marinimicrobia bacterium]|nr:exodeoxyribonuclease VII large subunit [Candidatus Neomarinimicrobiota bacterium]
MDEKIYTVSQISNRIQEVLGDFIPPVWVEGEVSNYYRSRAGHVYFSLKDDNSLINCVLWSRKADNLSFRIEDGMDMAVFGRVTSYQRQSQYQINVDKVQAGGKGKLFLAFEKLKKKLSKEGLFDDDLKQKIPQYPDRIGVVTSAEGAAIRDILNVAKRRNPSVEFVIFPSMVQGDKAAGTIIKGIETFNRLKNVDLIIIGRGGGSLEDLWAFNEEKLVRAVVKSELPIVSAVGHEVDFTLSDFAADKRSPTPSAAAELTVPSREEIINEIRIVEERMKQRLKLNLGRTRDNIDHLSKRIKALGPIENLKQYRQTIDDLERQIIRLVELKLDKEISFIDNAQKQLRSLSPKNILQKGYSLVYSREDGSVIKSRKQVQTDDGLEIEVSDGRFPARVENINNNNE